MTHTPWDFPPQPRGAGVPPIPVAHLRLVEPKRFDIHDAFAEHHQADPDEQLRRAAHDEIATGLFWATAGFVCGMMATVGLAYIVGLFL